MIRFATSALVLALAAGSVALADPPRQGPDRGHDRQHDSRPYDYRDNSRNDRGGHDRDRSDRDDRYGWSNGGHYGAPRGDYYPPQRYYPPRGYYAPRGYYGHRWQRGEWLPPAYRTGYYYAPDYYSYGYGVYAPPPGCRWVHYDGDLVLMALATGLVLDVVYGAYH
jgi:Ni/Co efflux regulator RcnB